MNDLTTVAQQFLTECREDYVGLWSLVWQIRHAGLADDSNIIETTLVLVMPLLLERKIIAGQFVLAGTAIQSADKNEFQRWEMPPKEVVAKIKAEWAKLGRDPDIGEIVWFTAK